jgi:hypothetical protein
MQVFGGDMYTVAFMFALLLMGLMRVRHPASSSVTNVSAPPRAHLARFRLSASLSPLAGCLRLSADS